MDFAQTFQGIGTMFYQDTNIVVARIVLIVLGIVLIWLGKRNTLEPLIMIPMGFGMAAVNAGVLFMSATTTGTLFVDPMVADTEGIMNVLQVNFLQPIYTFTFSNSLIACLVFMGIGVLADVGSLLRYPFTSMFIALFAELGTIMTLPIGKAMGLSYGDAAAIALVGTADGPMVLFSSLMLAPELFVPITVIAYLYLSLTYGGYPFLIRATIPKDIRGTVVKLSKKTGITSGEKLAFDVIACVVLCLLLPVASPLFMSFFLGNAIKESGIVKYTKMLEDVVLYWSTFFLGLLLGVLCDASTIMNPRVLPILILGIVALTLSGIGGIIGGYLVYWVNGKNFNPTIGIAGVSCIPTTAKIAHHEVNKANKRANVIQIAMGASLSGVITSAIITGIYISMLGKF
jgi:oxaloacetate decarboxylase beta subunit